MELLQNKNRKYFSYISILTNEAAIMIRQGG